MEENEREKLEQELMFLKESFDSEVISKEEYDKAKERIERKIKSMDKKFNNRKKDKTESIESLQKAKEIPKEPEKAEEKEAAPEPEIREEQPKEGISPAVETEEKAEETENAVESPIILNIPKKEEVMLEDARKEEPPMPVAAQTSSSKGGRWIWILLIVLVIGGVYYFYFTGISSKAMAEQGKAGTVVVEVPKIDSKVIVVGGDSCFNCDTSRMKDIISAWFPGIKIEDVSYESDEGGALADEFGLRILPAYIFDANAAKFPKFYEMEQIFEKTSDSYVLKDDASGGKLYFARENIPNKLGLFVIAGQANSDRALKNAQELIDKANGQVDFNIVEIKNDLAKELGIKNAPTFIINNRIKVSGVQSAEALKESFCKINSLEVCNETLSAKLI
ncbi:MAG: hypothetical protein US99_C0072G0004 [Candidatus Daviesbacteria bacterium GW2011_GWF2_38_6]|uniref:Thioredoxin-like fold domain-containing protein n=1 Tax=Candidatus Daviesbacteria bacterium GW2011_GWF2_38_6 TaxID=1618432 RepID=A0A0G0K9T7_9BACT|nr:MAG: hypothetical protein US99_C0072G0004 [Candidatus Daviesbacteria bacterium GW2011_GWF2_38_6]